LIEAVQKINPQKPVSVIPNGVDVQLFRPQPRKEIIAEKLGLSEQDTIVAFSGHITNEKGLDVLAKSAPYIIRDHPRVRFLIIGDGLYMKEFKALVSNLHLGDKFVFTGFVSGERLPDYLSLADVCVAPYTPGPWYKVSKVETPIKVVEYMAMGKPVVMSRISQQNVLTWGNGGLITTPGDVSELASSIITLIEDEKSRNSFGENGRKFIEKEYSWQKISKKLVSIYQSLNEHN
jgi:glycosyltransferase involved in cell wall biosynthesis